MGGQRKMYFSTLYDSMKEPPAWVAESAGPWLPSRWGFWRKKYWQGIQYNTALMRKENDMAWMIFFLESKAYQNWLGADSQSNVLRLLWTHDCFEWIELSYWMLSTSYTAPGAGPDGRCQRLSKNQWLSSSCSVFSVFAPRVFVAPGFRICTIQADFTKQIAATYMYTYKSHRKPWFQMFPANFSHQTRWNPQHLPRTPAPAWLLAPRAACPVAPAPGRGAGRGAGRKRRQRRPGDVPWVLGWRW